MNTVFPSARESSREHSYHRRQDQHADSQWQQDLPSYFHELIEAIARKRAAIPDVHIHRSSDLRGKPENILDTVAHRRGKQEQADRPEQRAESGKADRLHPEIWMLR